MSVPNYTDIGKAANDLLSKDFPAGQVKLELKTNAPNGVNFTANGHRDNKSGTIFGELKTKFTDKANGLTLTEGWTTTNVLSAKVELENRVANGVKLEVNAGFLPASGQKTGKIGLEYKQPGVLSRGHVDMFKGPIFNGDVCFGRDGILFGSEVGYDVLDGRVTRYNAKCAINNPLYALTLQAAGNMTQFSASYYHRVSSDVEVGGKAYWDSKSKNSNVAMEVGGKVTLDNNASVKAKVDHVGKLSLAYTQAIRPGVKVTMAGVFDTARLNENAHKVGLGVVFEN